MPSYAATGNRVSGRVRDPAVIVRKLAEEAVSAVPEWCNSKIFPNRNFYTFLPSSGPAKQPAFRAYRLYCVPSRIRRVGGGGTG